jgi:hypothetical protein
MTADAGQQAGTVCFPQILKSFLRQRIIAQIDRAKAPCGKRTIWPRQLQDRRRHN